MATITAPAVPEGTPAPAWTEGMSETDQAFIAGKGWQDSSSMMASYKNLEHFRGVPEDRLVSLPSDPDDAEAWSQVHTKLGRPGSPDDYEVPEYQTPEGGTDLTPAFRQWAFEAGLNQRQVGDIIGKFNGKMAELAEGADSQGRADNTLQVEQLHKEWGGAYDQNVEVARRAVARFGLDDATVQGLERGLGEAGAARLLHQIGKAVGEASGPDGTGAGPVQGWVMSPEEALQKIAVLKMDAQFMHQYMNEGNKDALQKMTSLMQLAYREES